MQSVPLIQAAILLLCVSFFVGLRPGVEASDVIKAEKTSFKVSFVEDGEKAARYRVTSEGGSISSKKVAQESMHIKSTDLITAQVSVLDGAGDPSGVEQAFLRFENVRTGKDNLYLMSKRGLDIKTDLDLKREIGSDPEFWTASDTYVVQIVLGDRRLSPSISWTVTTELQFSDKDAAVFAPKPRGVFDFDVSVKTRLLPEFESPIPVGEKRAPLTVVMLALIALCIPLPVLIVVWFRMDALPTQISLKDTDLLVVMGLHACILLHMAALVMFWIKWDIVTTWKVMGIVMIPTLIFVRLFLTEGKAGR